MGLQSAKTHQAKGIPAWANMQLEVPQDDEQGRKQGGKGARSAQVFASLALISLRSPYASHHSAAIHDRQNGHDGDARVFRHEKLF